MGFGERGTSKPEKGVRKSRSIGNRFNKLTNRLNNITENERTPEEQIAITLNRNDSNNDVETLRLKVKMLEFSNASKEDRLAKLEQENAEMNEKLKLVNRSMKLYGKIFDSGNSTSKMGVKFSDNVFGDLKKETVMEEIDDFGEDHKHNNERISVASSRYKNSVANNKYTKFVRAMDSNARKSVVSHHSAPISTADKLAGNTDVAMTAGAARIMGRLLDDLNIGAARKAAADLVLNLDLSAFSYAQFTLLAVPFERMLDDQSPVSILEGVRAYRIYNRT